MKDFTSKRRQDNDDTRPTVDKLHYTLTFFLQEFLNYENKTVHAGIVSGVTRTGTRAPRLQTISFLVYSGVNLTANYLSIV